MKISENKINKIIQTAIQSALGKLEEADYLGDPRHGGFRLGSDKEAYQKKIWPMPQEEEALRSLPDRGHLEADVETRIWDPTGKNYVTTSGAPGASIDDKRESEGLQAINPSGEDYMSVEPELPTEEEEEAKMSLPGRGRIKEWFDESLYTRLIEKYTRKNNENQ
mgnify:FL=1